MHERLKKLLVFDGWISPALYFDRSYQLANIAILAILSKHNPHFNNFLPAEFNYVDYFD